MPQNAKEDSSSNKQFLFQSILDQTPIKRHHSMEELADLGSSAGSASVGWRPTAASFSEDSSKPLPSRLEQCEKRVEEARKRVAIRFQEFQSEMQQAREVIRLRHEN